MYTYIMYVFMTNSFQHTTSIHPLQSPTDCQNKKALVFVGSVGGSVIVLLLTAIIILQCVILLQWKKKKEHAVRRGTTD